MEVLDKVRAYIKTNPEAAKRILILLVILVVGLPAGLWYIRSAEERAYAFFTQGYYAYRNRNYGQAAGQFNQLVSLHPNSKFAALGRYYLGMTHLANNNVDEAAGQFKYFINESGRHYLRERVFTIWMALELNAGRTENCVSLADRFLTEFGRTSSSSPEVLYRKGVALLRLGRADEAGASFKEAAESKENNIFGSLAFYAQTARPQL